MIGRVQQCAGGIAAVAQPHIHAIGLQAVAHPHKEGKLPLGKGHAHCGVLICHSKVGKDASDVQTAALRQFFHHRHGILVFGIKAQAAHAGIDLHMAIHHTAGFGGLRRQLQGVFLAEQRLRDGIAGQNRGRGGIGVAQHQNGPVDALSAQIKRLLHRSHAEPIGTVLLQLARHCGRAMAVAIGLYYGQITAAGAEKPADAVVVVRKSGQINGRPAALVIHSDSSPADI